MDWMFALAEEEGMPVVLGVELTLIMGTAYRDWHGWDRYARGTLT